MAGSAYYLKNRRVNYSNWVCSRFGFTSRIWGLALDVVKSATVVLGNGTIVSASENVNPDLYWVRF